MTVHISPFTDCNLGCDYCYEEPDRDVKGYDEVRTEYNIEQVMQKLEDWKEKYPGQTPGFHGGEPLLMDPEDMERVYEWIDENYDNDDSMHVQTNGTLISDEHIRIFEEYGVHCGISVDGPEELNDSRVGRGGDLDTTRKMTQNTHENLAKIVESEVSTGVIVVLHKNNAGTEEKVDKLFDWMDWLNRNDVSGHFNPAIPYEDVQEDLSLEPERLKEVYLRLYEWFQEEEYRNWDPIGQYKDNLLGQARGNCVNNHCDVFNAGSAKIVKGDGTTTGCGKTWSAVGDGVSFIQGGMTGQEYNDSDQRYDVLKQKLSPYSEEVQNGEAKDQGGCKGCRYWSVCTGGCPSSPLNHDYRNRTQWCPAKHALYEAIEEDIKSGLDVMTVVDFPWHLEASKEIAHGGVDFDPFRSEASPQAITDTLEQMNVTFEERLEVFRDVYPPDFLSIDREERSIHADSAPSDENLEPTEMTPYAEDPETQGTGIRSD